MPIDNRQETKLHDTLNSIETNLKSYKEANAKLASELSELKEGISKNNSKKSFDDLREKMKGFEDKHAADMAEFNKIVAEVQTSNGSEIEQIEALTTGEFFVASKSFEAAQRKGDFKSLDKIEIDFSSRRNVVRNFEFTNEASDETIKKICNVKAKSLTVQDLRDANIAAPQYIPGTLQELRDPFDIRSYMTVIPVQQTPVHYSQMTGYSPVSSAITADVAPADTTIDVASIAGFMVGHPAMLEDSSSKTKLAVTAKTPTNASEPNGPGTITVATAVGVAYTVGNKSHLRSAISAATVELNKKPFGHIGWQGLTADVKTIATLLKTSVQSVEDVPQIIAEIDAAVRNNEPRTLFAHILEGNGGADQLQGIATYPGNLVQTYDQSTHVGSNKYDAIRRLRTKIDNANGQANLVLMNNNDGEDIDLLRADGANAGPYMELIKGGQVWNMRVLFTNMVEEGKFVVGDFQRGASLLQKKQLTMKIADQNEDDFNHNLLTLRHEQRVGIKYNYPELFGYGAFA